MQSPYPNVYLERTFASEGCLLITALDMPHLLLDSLLRRHATLARLPLMKEEHCVLKLYVGVGHEAVSTAGELGMPELLHNEGPG